MKTVVVVGTLDTKGEAYGYLKERIEEFGVRTIVIDWGMMNEPCFKPDISASEVARACGKDIAEIRAGERAESIGVMASGVVKIVKELRSRGELDGIIVLGGGQGSSIAIEVFSALPIGLPKVIVSTAPGMVTRSGGLRDAFVVGSIVDIAGLNGILKAVLQNAAAAIAGVVNAWKEPDEGAKPRIAATMLGVTTGCVDNVREILTGKGYEVLVFHANGNGGASMEDLIGQGYFTGVVDVTTAEIASYLTNRDPKLKGRLEAAGKAGVPQVVSLGGLDRINISGEDVPEKYKGRKIGWHNPRTLMIRTSAEENEEFGKVIAGKLNKAKGKTALAIPLRGISVDDREGNFFYDPAANKALFDSVRKNLNPNIDVVEMDCHIMDTAFTDKLTELILELTGGGL